MSDLQEVSEVVFPLLDAIRQEYCVRRLLIEVTEERMRILQMLADGEIIVLY